jgi:hypothetical protein
VVEHRLQGFAAPDCTRRWETIEEYTDRMIGRVLRYEESGADRAEGVRAWRDWWEQNKARSSSEKITQ